MSHMPPELLRHGRMSCAVDIYAFGVMMWELYTREVAFRELHYGQVGVGALLQHRLSTSLFVLLCGVICARKVLTTPAQKAVTCTPYVFREV